MLDTKKENYFRDSFMRSNTKHTTKELEKYIQIYLEDGLSYYSLKRDYRCD